MKNICFLFTLILLVTTCKKDEISLEVIDGNNIDNSLVIRLSIEEDFFVLGDEHIGAHSGDSYTLNNYGYAFINSLEGQVLDYIELINGNIDSLISNISSDSIYLSFLFVEEEISSGPYSYNFRLETYIIDESIQWTFFNNSPEIDYACIDFGNFGSDIDFYPFGLAQTVINNFYCHRAKMINGNVYTALERNNEGQLRYYWQENLEPNDLINVNTLNLPFLNNQTIVNFSAPQLRNSQIYGILNSDINALHLVDGNYTHSSSDPLLSTITYYHPDNIFDNYLSSFQLRVDNKIYNYDQIGSIPNTVSIPNWNYGLILENLNNFKVNLAGDFLFNQVILQNINVDPDHYLTWNFYINSDNSTLEIFVPTLPEEILEKYSGTYFEINSDLELSGITFYNYPEFNHLNDFLKYKYITNQFVFETVSSSQVLRINN
jgi:hypothetical protein